MVKSNISDTEQSVLFRELGNIYFGRDPAGIRGFLLADCIKAVVCNGACQEDDDSEWALRPITDIFDAPKDICKELVFTYLSDCIPGVEPVDKLAYFLAQFNMANRMHCMSLVLKQEQSILNFNASLAQEILRTGLQDLIYKHLQASLGDCKRTAVFT